MKISEHFLLEEFVPKNIFTQWGEKSIWFIDPKIVVLAEFARVFFGKPVTINNWHKGGSFNYRGFRDPEAAVGAKLSQHRFGRAIDINVSGLTPQQVYTSILNNQEAFIRAGLTTMEDINSTPTWCHLDVRQVGLPTFNNKIKIVLPL